MPYKKQIKNISKKIIISLVGILTVISMTGGPALAAPPQATQVAVTQNVARIIFDQNVVKAGTQNPPDLVNFSLQSPTGTPQILSGLSPYSQWTSYDFASGPNIGISQIYGLNALNLSVGQSFRLSFSNIFNTSGDSVTPSSVDGVVTLGPQLDNITPIYAKAGNQVTLTGTRFSSGNLTTPDVWVAGTQASVVSTTTAEVDGVVMITGVTVTVPTGLSTAYGGTNLTSLVNQDTVLSTNSRPLYFYNANFGVLTGKIIDGGTGATSASVDGVAVQAYKNESPWDRYQGETQKDGKFAIVVPAGTYNIAYTTPGSGSVGAAPLKSTGQVVTANSVTNIGTISFVTKVVYGKVYAPNGTTPLYGARVKFHDQTWTVEQEAKTGSDGSYKVYVTPSTTAPQYIIEVEPSDYDRNVNGYLSTSTTINVATAGPHEKNITLATLNVTGIVKTPTGDVSESNPFPDTVVPGAHVHIYNSDWTVDKWTDTIREVTDKGKFQFAGIPDGTYTLELEAPWCGDSDANVAKFCGYTRTRFENIVISGVTDLGIKRFTSPNFFGYVFADTVTVNGTYDSGEGLSNAWVNMNKEGFWTGSQTDANGRYAFYLPGTGRYWINVQPPTGANYASYSGEIEVTTLPLTTPYNIKLSAPNVLGYVYGPTGTEGQKWAWVDFCPYEAPGTCYGGGTGDTGQFSLNVADGTWGLNVHPDWKSIYSSPAPKKVTVSGGIVTQVDTDSTVDTTEPLITGRKIVVRLTDPAVNGLKGTVYDPTGTNPQENIGIGLRPAVAEGGSCRGEGMSRWTQTSNETATKGQYAFGDVAAGLYEIEAMPWGTSQYSRVRVCHTITSEAATRTKNIPLTSPNITGTIKTPTGATTDENPTPDTAVQYAWVSLFVEGPMGPGGGWYGGNANENGIFGLGGVAAGTYTMEINPQWGTVYTSKRYTGIVIDATGECTKDGNNDGTPGAGNCTLNTLTGVGDGTAIRVGVPNLKGQIVDPTGNAVRWVWVMVHDQYWTKVSGGNTDDQGYFRIGGLSDDTYQIEINLPWGGGQAFVAPSGLSVVITNNVGVIKLAGTALPGNKITLTTPKKIVTGWVKKADGTAVGNAKVEAHRDMGGGFFETKTDPTTGTYTLKVSGGSWWVTTWPSWEGTQPDWVYTEPPTRITFAEDASDECAGTTTACAALGKTNTQPAVNFSVTACDATVTGEVKKTDNTAVQYAWIDVRGNKGMGNSASTDNNGRFSVKVPAGTYTVVVFSNLADYGSPDPKSVTVASGKTADAGTLYLKAKNAHIKGFVQDDAGNPVSNVIVNAWLFDKPGGAMTYTDQTGAYDLLVWEGTWGVMVMSMSQDYIYQGAPLKIDIKANETSSGNNFVLKIANKTLKVKVKKADGTIVTDIWGGVWVKDTSAAGGMLDFGGPMEDMMMGSGMMVTAGGTSGEGVVGGGGAMMGPGMEKGGFMGGGLMNGYTEIKVPAGAYEVGLGMPPGSKYTLSATKTVTILATDTEKTIDLIVKVNDATISGYFYLDADGDGAYDAGEAVTGIRAFIHADRVGGGWQMTESNATTGAYTLSVCGGEWYVDAFIDPYMVFAGANQYLVINEDVTATVADGGSAARNFKVKKLDATITGTVRNPDGTAMTGTAFGLVWVFADFGSGEMVAEFKGPGGPGLGTFTNVDGTYSLKVPAGTYKIGAGIPPWDTRDLLNPDMITVTVASAATSSGNDLQFKASDATVTGNITLDGVKKAGYVRAWSKAGRASGTFDADGTYSLKITQNDVWHLIAATEINNTLYESAEAIVSTTTLTSYSQNLALVSKNITIPEGVTSSFDASTAKTMKLTKTVDSTVQDEVILEIPAGAIATSGTITVSIIPTVNVRPDAKDKPIGVLYDFIAKDSSSNEITEFVQNVTITIYYDPALIEAAGYSEDSITPKYFDDSTGSWENYPNVIRDPENNRFIIKTDHFSPGGPTGGGAIPNAPSSLSAGAAGAGSISLTWIDNSDNETGFKVYRNSSDSNWDSAATLITTAAANATSYLDTNLTANTTYYYRVKATSGAGDSPWSNTAGATTGAAAVGGAAVIGGAAAAVEEVVEVVKVEVVEKPIAEMTPAEKAAKIVEVKTSIAQVKVQLIVLIRELITLIQAQIVELQAQLTAMQTQ